MAVTTKWGLPQPAGSDAISLGDDAITAGFLALDDHAKFQSGTLGARPTAATAKSGVFYYAFDATPPRVDVSDGTVWHRVYPLDDLEVTAAKLATAVQFALGTPGDYKYSVQAADHGDLGGGMYAWLLADGRETPAGYTALIAALTARGNPFGTSNGHPKLPDLLGRDAIGVGAGAGLTSRAIGAKGGEEVHVLSTGEMPGHAHTVTDPGHGHSYGDTLITSSSSATGPGGVTVATGWADGARNTNTALTGVTIQASGGGLSHNNMQPYLAGGSWFIKT